VTAPSEATLSYARKLVPTCIQRSCVVHVGTRHPRIEPGPIPTDPALLCLGRLVRIKGFDLAITALPRILEKFPSVRLIIAGDGPERGSLERQARELGVEDAVDFLGWVAPSEVPALINTASILVLPSRADAFPLAGIQAAFMERPVVATRVGGIPELVVDGETGLLVEAENTAGLADAILSLLDHPEKVDRLGEAARERSLKLFDIDRIADSYQNLYRRIVAA
jgi:glycogen(starch) synthase